MKILDCIHLAFLNIRGYFKTSFIMFLGMLLSLCMITVSCSYHHSVERTFGSLLNESLSRSCVNTYIGEESEEELLDILKGCQEITEIRKSHNFGNMQNIIYSDSNFFTNANSNISDSFLVADSKEYKGIDDNSYVFFSENTSPVSDSDRSVYLSIMSLDISGQYVQFAEVEKKEYSEKHKGNFLIGEELKEETDVIMSEYILSKYGIPLEKAEELIGKNISLKYITKGTAEYVFKDYRLCGILKTDFYDVSNIREQPHIIVAMSGNFFTGMESLTLFADDFAKAKSIYKFLESKDIIRFSTNEVWLYSDIQDQQKVYNELISFVLVMIVCSIMIFLFASFSYYFKKRLRFVVMERSIGMTGGKIFAVFLSELLISSLTAFAVSVPVSYVLTNVVSGIMEDLLGGKMNISLNDFTFGLLYSVLFVAGVSLIITVVQIKGLKKYNLQSLISE